MVIILNNNTLPPSSIFKPVTGNKLYLQAQSQCQHGVHRSTSGAVDCICVFLTELCRASEHVLLWKIIALMRVKKARRT
jgi:hypothetical protein